MKTRILATLSLALVLALPAAANAALPKPSTTLIVPGKSIGGVALGATGKTVEQAWGKTKECELTCVYEGGGESPAEAGVALEQPPGGGTPWVAARIFLNIGQNKIGGEFKPDFDTTLAVFKTAKGIGIGSSVAEVQRAYPAAKKQVVGLEKTFTLKGKGEIETQFFASEGKQVTSVAISAHPGG